MTRLMFASLSLITIFALMMGISMRIGQDQASPARVERLHLADCNLPCWNGITPGVSLPGNAKARIDAALTDFTSASAAANSKFLTWTETDDLDRIVSVVNVSFENGRVDTIGIGTDHTSEEMPSLGEVLAVFGAPTCITLDEPTNRSKWFYENSAQHFTLQFSALAVSLTSLVNNIVFGVSDDSICEETYPLSWGEFRALRPSFLAAP